MKEKGLKPQFYTGLSYNQFRDSIPQRKKEWDGIDVQGISMKKPYDYKSYSDMSYAMVEKSTESVYPTSRKETQKPGWTAQSPVFDNPISQIIQPTSGSYEIATEADDGIYYGMIDYFVSDAPGGFIGYNSSSGLVWNFMRYSNVLIDKGTLQSPIKIKFTANQAHYNSPVTAGITPYFYIVLADDPEAPTNGTTFNAMELSEGIPWLQTDDWDDQTENYSCDLSVLIEQVVNRSGWSPGNHIIIVLKNMQTMAENNFNYFYFYDGSPTKCPILTGTG